MQNVLCPRCAWIDVWILEQGRGTGTAADRAAPRSCHAFVTLGRCLDCAMQLACMRVCVHLCVCVSTHTWSLTNNWKTHNLQNQPQPVLLPTPNWITACISMKQQRREHWKRTFFRRWNQPLHSNLTWANLQPSFQLKFNEQLLCIRNGGCSDLIGSLPLSLINISPVFWTFFFNIERLESVRMGEGIDDIKEYWWQDRNRTSWIKDVSGTRHYLLSLWSHEEPSQESSIQVFPQIDSFSATMMQTGGDAMERNRAGDLQLLDRVESNSRNEWQEKTSLRRCLHNALMKDRTTWNQGCHADGVESTSPRDQTSGWPDGCRVEGRSPWGPLSGAEI